MGGLHERCTIFKVPIKGSETFERGVSDPAFTRLLEMKWTVVFTMVIAEAGVPTLNIVMAPPSDSAPRLAPWIRVSIAMVVISQLISTLAGLRLLAGLGF